MIRYGRLHTFERGGNPQITTGRVANAAARPGHAETRRALGVQGRARNRAARSTPTRPDLPEQGALTWRQRWLFMVLAL